MASKMTTYPDVTRYCFYRVHKFLSAFLAGFEQKVAVVDFTNAEEVAKITDEFCNVKDLVFSHAHFEDQNIHQLLRDKKSHAHEMIESEHHDHDAIFENMASLLQEIKNNPSDINLCKQKGYEFYLEYRKFYGDTLLHLHNEETILLPELQRVCLDEELRTVDAATYKILTPEQMLGMLKTAFPNFNYWDKEAFLISIKLAQPDKLTEIWPEVVKIVSIEEMNRLSAALEIHEGVKKAG